MFGSILAYKQGQKKQAAEQDRRMAEQDKRRAEQLAHISTQIAVIQNDISNLTNEVRKHNNFAQRVPVLEEKAKVSDARIKDLEDWQLKSISDGR